MLTYYYRARAFTSGAVSRRFNQFQSRYLYLTPRYLRYLSQTIVVTPWVTSLIALGLFAFVPQMQEIYIGVIEDRDYPRGLLGLASIAGFSSFLYYYNLKVVTERIDAIYPDHANIHFDRRVFDMRDFKTMVTASFPFAGLCIGLVMAYARVESTAIDIEAVTGKLGDGLDRADALHTRLQSLPHDIFLCLYFTAAVAVGLMFALHSTRNYLRWRCWFLYGCYGLAFVLFAVPVAASTVTLVASRIAGPLASTGLVLIALAVCMRVLVWLASHIISAVVILPSIMLFSVNRWPVALRYIVVVLVPTLVVVLIGADVFRLAKGNAEIPKHVSLLDDPNGQRQMTVKHRDMLDTKFVNWLGARETGSGDYPVFIVTAQGGGMYASAAASFFLAKMQERCPGFAEHVFAISAVSGGSIGAALFDAALEEGTGGKDTSRAAGSPAGCREPEKAGALFERLRGINADDHLSPVLAYILPDLVRDIRELFTGTINSKEPCKSEALFDWFGRDQMLEKSFIASFEQSRNVATSQQRGTPDWSRVSKVCPAPTAPDLLMRGFKEVRPERHKVPYLLMNATWVETGYRVAFSPFPLQHIGEGTLYSFDDVGELDRPGEELRRNDSWLNPSLIRAAAVSARFPFILPPWVSGPEAKNHWSFVDGGYADSSGATTGLELYLELSRELPKLLEARRLKNASGKEIGSGQVKLYLIALTDAYAEPDYRRITGTTLDNFIAPFNTLLTVRELLAQRAVTRANAQLRAKGATNGLMTIQLDQLSFALPLGWKQSRLSSDVIRFAMGRPDRCNGKIEEDAETVTEPKPLWPVWTVNHNSCELKRVTALFEPRDSALSASPQLPSASPAPPQQAPAPAVLAPKTFGSWQVTPQ